MDNVIEVYNQKSLAQEAVAYVLGIRHDFVLLLKFPGGKILFPQEVVHEGGDCTENGMFASSCES